MTVDVRWYNEDADILIVRYTGRWTWEEAHDANIISQRLLSTAQKRIDLITDMSATPWFPAQTVENLHTLSSEPYHNLQLAVLVGNDFFHDIFQTYLNNFGELPYVLTFAESFKQAVDKILSSRLPSKKNTCFRRKHNRRPGENYDQGFNP